MNKIVSIGTAVPKFKHTQQDLCDFAATHYATNTIEERKLRFLYRKSGIEQKYSVVPDFSCVSEERTFLPNTNDLEPFPTVERRMELFQEHSATLSAESISKCIEGKISAEEITHLITVTCTGLSAPGLDLELLQILQLPTNVIRTSVNFMGCYAAIHAMKMADAFCSAANGNVNIVVVCTELCTLHFQKEISEDNITSTLLFGDGSAAFLMQNDRGQAGLGVKSFYSEVAVSGKNEMAWGLSSSGFIMKLSGMIPNLIKQDFEQLSNNALHHAGVEKSAIDHWCMHPGGKKILDTLAQCLQLNENDMNESYDILKKYGNMSSCTILFVLEEILRNTEINNKNANIFGAAFGPGLTMETFLLNYVQS